MPLNRPGAPSFLWIESLKIRSTDMTLQHRAHLETARESTYAVAPELIKPDGAAVESETLIPEEHLRMNIDSMTWFRYADKTIEDRVRARLSSISEDIQTKLPRELRDRVYQFYLEDYPNDSEESLGNLVCNLGYLREYFGLEAVTELATAAYSTLSHKRRVWRSTFSGLGLDNLVIDAKELKHGIALLRRFLEHDAFGLGFRPFDYMRTVSILLKTSECFHDGPEFEALQEGTLTYASGRTFKLNLWTDVIQHVPELERILGDFHRIYEELAPEECTLNLKMQNYWDEDPWYSEDEAFVSLSLDDLYALPREDWEEEILSCMDAPERTWLYGY
ncbi:hypothetical protein SLS60_005472 [Paraconiothyrium brasiliense]|uniref:Uncharacterized protein n=1 Tax=Paraconiothyrium brasiliense TaxID=300254 RepID=A0ABR3RHG1_9PLEO